jgi:DNA-binding transcriptional LysR family regulator
MQIVRSRCQVGPVAETAPARQSVFVCASKGYLKNHGVPRRPHDLISHNCLTYAYSPQETDWPFVRGGIEQQVRVSGSLRVNNGHVLVNAAIEGLGIIRQPNFLVGQALRCKLLVRVLPAWNAGDHAVYAVYASRRFLPLKVRAFSDFLAERFSESSAFSWRSDCHRSQPDRVP